MLPLPRLVALQAQLLRSEAKLDWPACRVESTLNERQDALKSDFINANKLPDYYDTDIENFWTNPSKKKYWNILND